MKHRARIVSSSTFLLCTFLLLPWTAAGVVEPATPGALRVESEDGTIVDMPLRHTRVTVEISAFVSSTHIEQVFENPFDQPVEAVYTFPLGDRAAVDDFELVVGERTIRGEIQRREQARQVYERARSAGHHAALLEQQRPNIFTQSVANLGPGREIVVRIRTSETLQYDKGTYRFTFPLVVGPRYMPDAPSPAIGATSQTISPIPAVYGEERINPPVSLGSLRSGHDVEIDVRLDAGVAISGLKSPSHRIRVDRPTDSSAAVQLAPDDTIPNKDFMLRWSVSSEKPALGVLCHRDGVDGFFTLLVQPKGEIDADEAAPKEIVFVLDTSGSMQGIPLEASKRFVRQAIESLGPRDTFNFIRFAARAEVLSPHALTNSPDHVERALSWVRDLRGGGGTEMLKGIRAAFTTAPDPDRMKMVVFLTDGYIGNEVQILAAVGEAVGDARIFSLGVGSGVNHYLLDRMAEIGQGAYVFIRGDENPDVAVDRFRSWVTRPYLTDIEIDWGALPVADVPSRARDLFSGQTLTLVGRYLGEAEGEIVVRGKLGGRHWEQRHAVRLPHRDESNASLASLWARRRIADLMTAAAADGMMTDGVRAEVTTLALEFRLMSRFTSFVAVDDAEVVNPSGEAETVHHVVPLPEGTTFGGVFGPDGPPILQAFDDTDRADDPEDVADESTFPVGTGGIRVRILDAADASPLPGATVVLTHVRSLVAESASQADVNGVAEFPALRPGEGYVVRAMMPGYAAVRKDRIRVGVGRTQVIAIALGEEIAEVERVVAARDVVNLEKTSTTSTFGDEFMHALPVQGRIYTNVLTVAPGVQDQDGDGNPNVHRVRVRHYAAIVGGVSNVDPLAGGSRSSDLDDSAYVAHTALRVLADLAEDGKLSSAEGRPALAALLGSQRPGGVIAVGVEVQALATWALLEAHTAQPDDPWIELAFRGAVDWLVQLHDPEAAVWVAVVLAAAHGPSACRQPQTLEETFAKLDRLQASLTDWRNHASVELTTAGSTFDRLLRALGRGNLAVVN